MKKIYTYLLKSGIENTYIYYALNTNTYEKCIHIYKIKN